MDQLVNTTKSFLDLFQTDLHKDDLAHLFNCLSELNYQFSKLQPISTDADDVETKSLSNAELRAIVTKKYPSLSFYAVALQPDSLTESEIGLADAIDDLADIYHDLDAGYQLFTSGHLELAQWQWRFSYRSHWSAHLTALQSYLNQKLLGCN